MVARRGTPLAHPAAADAMAHALRHRSRQARRRTWDDALLGVTGSGWWISIRAPTSLHGSTGMVTLVCNGEIYNASALRRRYADFPFRSASDVEVVLPLFLDRGADGLADLDGMFALAVLDRRAGHLVLARDRAGEKPLFTTVIGDEQWFASEIGALLQADAVGRALDMGALWGFLRHGYVREPLTPFAGIRKVPAGTIMVVDDRGTTVRRYWDPDAPPESPVDLATLLRAAVARQVRADVPVGVFTSGGLDSSLLAALAAEAIGPARVRTFAVVFPDRSYDERRIAERLARALGTTHGPPSWGHQIPAARRLAARASQWVIRLRYRRSCSRVRPSPRSRSSGRGGADELFGGYPPKRTRPSCWARASRARGRAARHRGAAASGGGPLAFLLSRFVGAAHLPWPERHLAWFANGLPEDALGLAWAEPVPPHPGEGDPVAGAMRLDYEGPLRERLLVKVDRATMRASVEARAPFLDPAVTRAARAAGGTHVSRFAMKRLLREVARPILPRFILRRRKRGLSVPLYRWLNGPLAAAADRLPAPGRLAASGLVDPARVAALLAAHRAGRADHGRALWTLLVARHWLTYWNLEIEP
jgi:asparagine synthase (glutamine-hydrolysing)